MGGYMAGLRIITGGKDNTPKEVYAKFPWLETANITNACVDISNRHLVWKGGIWEGGVWKSGHWKGGHWKDGYMWSNLHIDYKSVMYDNERGMFVPINE
jgi:hypothetical protein